MKKLWLAAVMAVSVVALQTPAAADPRVNGIPAQGPHGVHGIIIHRCWHHHRCCHRYGRRCGPIGIVVGHGPIGIIGRRPIGTRPIGIIGQRPIGVPTRGGGVGPVNGVPVDQHVQH